MNPRPRLLICPALLATSIACIAAATFPGAEWSQASPGELQLDAAQLEKAKGYALTGGGSGLIIRHGKVAMTWGDQGRRYDLKSTSKSIGVTALGVALLDEKVDLHDRAGKHHPDFETSVEEPEGGNGWSEGITLFHLATQTAGFEKPGGAPKLLFQPGAKWHYSDSGPNWLAECLTLIYEQDMRDLLFERVFTPIGIRSDDLTWRNNAYRPHQINGIARREFGSGAHANVNAMARIGLLYLNRGHWKDGRLLPEHFVALASGVFPQVAPLEEQDTNHGDASAHYGLLWWNNADGTLDIPRDTYWSWGLYDSLIVVMPSLDMVVARAGKSWARDWDGHYDVLAPFLAPIAKAVRDTPAERPAAGAPYPQSEWIAGIRWDEPEQIRRKAEGSDNWPITWAADDRLYTAYGDGWGFEPKTEKKLSLGLSVVEGGPLDFKGNNLRSETAETIGQGANGKKASGMLMVDGEFYMWVRNANNSQLAWSSDNGKTWTWSDWRWETSFGAPTFLNFGKNYSGARDGFVYIYSHDSDSAYEAADRMVLARVPKDQIRDQKAYEFFAGFNDGEPSWLKDINDRAAVFEHAGGCYRSGITYHPILKRYLWSQTLPGTEARFEGGFGVYEAPEPWGPWSTVYFAKRWDVGPGETSNFPTKWMATDGRTIHMVFSGEDAFSVRRGVLMLKP